MLRDKEQIMQKRQLGASDVQITPILMGTWQAGKKSGLELRIVNQLKQYEQPLKPESILLTPQKCMVKDILSVL
jgi:hypothetical protein